MAKKSTSSVKPEASMRIVVLWGPERFLIDEYTRLLAESLEAKFGGIERFRFDGQTVAPAAVLDELRSYGLMQKHKLVILDNADDFLAGGGKGAAEREVDDEDAGEAADEQGDEKSPARPLLERYAENPVPDATLLMRARLWRAGKLDKAIAKSGGAIIKCDQIDEERAMGWCMNRVAKRYGATLAPDAAHLLVSRIGPGLLHLDTELAKLAAMAGASKTITRNMVAEAVGLSREEKAWEIQAAVLSGDGAVMLRKLRELLDVSQVDEVPIAWAICDLMRKMHNASQLLRLNVPPQGVRAQAKLWGPAGDAVLHFARRHDPMVFAQLLQAAIEADLRAKSGFDPQRTLEGLLVKIADKFRPVAA